MAASIILRKRRVVLVVRRPPAATRHGRQTSYCNCWGMRGQGVTPLYGFKMDQGRPPEGVNPPPKMAQIGCQRGGSGSPVSTLTPRCVWGGTRYA